MHKGYIARKDKYLDHQLMKSRIIRYLDSSQQKAVETLR